MRGSKVEAWGRPRESGRAPEVQLWAVLAGQDARPASKALVALITVLRRASIGKLYMWLPLGNVCMIIIQTQS